MLNKLVLVLILVVKHLISHNWVMNMWDGNWVWCEWMIIVVICVVDENMC